MTNNFLKLEEVADHLGMPVDKVKALVQTHLVRVSRGLVSLDDVATVREAEKSLGDLGSLVTEVAALKAEVLRQRHIIQFVLHVAGLQQHLIEVTDPQLMQLLEIARMGREAITPISARTIVGRIQHIVELCFCLTEREFRRMERLTKEPQCWKALIFLVENIDDALDKRPDLKRRPEVQKARSELNLARLHLVNLGKFTLALNDPFCNPKELLGEICFRAAKLDLLTPASRGFDPGQAISAFADEIRPSTPPDAEPTRRCPDGGTSSSPPAGSTDTHGASRPASPDGA